jgi:hypothetical protein
VHSTTVPMTPGASLGDISTLPIHPLTGLRAVGIVGGRPVWPIRGGSGEGEGGQAGDPQGAPPAAVTPPAAGGQQPATPPAVEAQDVSSLPPWAQKLITDTRSEAAKHRTEKQTAAQQAQAAQAQRDAILKAAGLKPDGTEADPDPAALAEQIQEARAVAWTNAVELSVVRSALAVGADSEKLIDSRAFIDSLDAFVDLDPNSAEFKTKLADHVKAYVDKHPTFKAAAPGPARSGGDHPGGAGQPPAERGKGGIAGAINRHYGRTG